ncbi:phosphonate ABC transporter, permease protein PhnE [Demequina zhanjiangensis]|uniref:Phosphonate ABC transporter, permease protein PhnE n=1 Tax=Demequina zhanjiangensis TaxID=3051659 RepID=A0ABT8G070_9MICO|nr:phosphonate ABC transporter, permease protein PhnE [Demequina sp. SYSU T00b26]MDN4472535.1 phosphonate ABC transporter, permease protein PhnE [Demequina sp. SYSU T00b26]
MTVASPAPAGVARPKKPAPSRFLIAGLAVTAAITVWAAWEIDFTLGPLFENFANGWVVVEQFLRPNWGYLDNAWTAWLETISIAIVASFFGVAVGLIFAYMASNVTNRSTRLYRLTKWFLSVLRSLPDVAYVLIFVALVGVGSLAGILALFIFNIGIAAKLTSETIDAVDPGPLEAADAAGNGTFSRARWAVQPQILPNFLSYALYIFELNIRSSVVIGYAGGGGIGYLIQVQFARFNYENVSAIVISMFLVVLLIDQLSQYLRRRLV